MYRLYKLGEMFWVVSLAGHYLAFFIHINHYESAVVYLGKQHMISKEGTVGKHLTMVLEKYRMVTP